MDRDGRWNRGRGHARVPGDCSHWLENRVKRGETWQGFGGRGENRGWPMSINGSPSTACLPFSPPLFLPVHNNFDSRVIIAFSKNKSFRKNISIILGIAIPNHFFFIRWLHLFLTRTFCLSASFFVSVFFFFLIRHDFTLPLLYLCGFNAWLHFSSSLTTTRLFSISNPPFSFISPPPQSRSSIELSSTPAKSGQRTLSHLSNRICLPSVPSIPSFLTRSKKKIGVQNKSWTSCICRHTRSTCQQWAVVKILERHVSPKSRSLQTESSLFAASTLFENSSHHLTDPAQSNRPGQFDPKLFRFDWQVDRRVTTSLSS